MGCSANSRSTLEYLERTNLFIVPLDDERRWYRYHISLPSFCKAACSASSLACCRSCTAGRSLVPAQRSARHAIHHALAAADLTWPPT